MDSMNNHLADMFLKTIFGLCDPKNENFEKNIFMFLVYPYFEFAILSCIIT